MSRERIEVLVRINGRLFSLGQVPVAEGAEPSSWTIADALAIVADRLRFWRVTRDEIEDVA